MKWKLKEICMYVWGFIVEDGGYGLPLLDYAWLIQLINKRNASPQNTVQSTSLNLEHTRDHITKNATTAHSWYRRIRMKRCFADLYEEVTL